MTRGLQALRPLFPLGPVIQNSLTHCSWLLERTQLSIMMRFFFKKLQLGDIVQSEEHFLLFEDIFCNQWNCSISGSWRCLEASMGFKELSLGF